MDSTSTQPLADRSTNTHLPLNGEKAVDMKGTEDRQSQATYVSPSDDIMSPCTKKLSDIKGKRFKTAKKPQSLFAKLGKKNFEQSSMAAAKEKNSSPVA
ncbi:hypothetical protein MPDQ_001812 [Monascus purpureus]|uniref:Spo12 n=1 Tax=Monascus purpureus TaxID=5098 RepID=A0A507QQK8_MONPU|nr:hypothetical protein MPDQ_001812 [Monascus purpureus]BDD62059.1 hypothetical protein MAP00_007052 [Monascus purpureus]